MGNDNKTVRSKINNLTVLCENLWPILYYLGGPLLALSSGSSRMYRKSTDKLLCEVCSLSLFYGLKLQLILLLTVLLSLPINDLPYSYQRREGAEPNFTPIIAAPEMTLNDSLPAANPIQFSRTYYLVKLITYFHNS